MRRRRLRRRSDPQQAPVYTFCCWCGGEIYYGQAYYGMPDRAVCAGCLLQDADRRILPLSTNRRSAGVKQP